MEGSREGYSTAQRGEAFEKCSQIQADSSMLALVPFDFV